MSDLPLKIREANSSDSKSLNSFFTSVPISGSIEIKIAREEHFFSFYQRLNLPYKTFILEDGEEILGTASFLIRELQFQDKTLKIAQACDLRIAPNRKAILSWSKFFLPLIEDIRLTENCDAFITSINHTETQAMNGSTQPDGIGTNSKEGCLRQINLSGVSKNDSHAEDCDTVGRTLHQDIQNIGVEIEEIRRQ